MHEHGSLPRARRDGLLEETAGEELLLYDQNSHTAHCLSSTAAGVWRHCDGERDVTELAELAEASESLVADALQELREKDLLAGEPSLTERAVPGVSRREAIVRVARYGATAAGASLIVSATAATSAMAASCQPCKTCVAEKESICCSCCDGQCITISKGDCETQCLAANHGTAVLESKEMRCSP
ncbi:MAG TPA: PqqD family protein [Solirubrobacteraceae bacterium]|jgi:hypothetical protein|nr:PqqD family protein [Solirubrobacteraceae bacterium]